MRAADASDPLRPAGADWNQLSPRYAVVRRISSLIANLIVWGAAVAAAVVFGQQTLLTAAVVVAGVAWTAWRVWRCGRWVRAWAWAERDSDLCIASGLWTRELTVIPFGRMQMVEVRSGPLLRWQGLAQVQLVTAAVQSRAQLPGLTQQDATALRDRLIERSDAAGAGL